jgi:hypothetical protein
MQVMRLLLEDQSTAGEWGSSLKTLVILLLMFILGIGVFVWWVRRG